MKPLRPLVDIGEREPSPQALILAVSLLDVLRTEWGQDVLADLLMREGWKCRPPRWRRTRQ